MSSLVHQTVHGFEEPGEEEQIEMILLVFRGVYKIRPQYNGASRFIRFIEVQEVSEKFRYISES